MNNKKITIATLALSLSMVIISCRSTDNAVDGKGSSGNSSFLEGTAMLKMDIMGEEFETGSDNSSPMASVKGNVGSVTLKEQTKTVMVDDKALVATLTPVIPSLSTMAKASSGAMAAVTPITGSNIKYRMIVYKTSDGSRIGSKTYTINAGVSVPDDGNDLYLDHTAGNYSFVILSYGTNVLPADVAGSLGSASLTGISGDSDLMYFRKDNVMLVKGSNPLNAVLQHMFSQITVKLDATNVSPGNGIQSITPATISRHRTANNSINLSDGTITYSATDIGSRTLDFSGNATTSAVWTAKPALIVNPGTGGAEAPALTLTNMTVGAKVKTQTINGLLVKPGAKYNLNITFKCTSDALPTYNFTMSDPGGGSRNGNVITQRFTPDAPAADAGFTFEVYKLDNSFNLSINSQNISNNEVQFEYISQGQTYPQNIRFKSDRALWGISPGVSQIYNMDGTTTAPKTSIAQIIIATDGTVTMMGRRSLTLPLEPIEMYDPNTGTPSGTGSARAISIAKTATVVPFNKVTWNSTATNVVIASMIIQNATALEAFGHGSKIIPCQ
ncbi:TPA: fimbrillin family protein [Elizabethkingia anophelis]